jgi:hypothetical protein
MACSWKCCAVGARDNEAVVLPVNFATGKLRTRDSILNPDLDIQRIKRNIYKRHGTTNIGGGFGPRSLFGRGELSLK